MIFYYYNYYYLAIIIFPCVLLITLLLTCSSWRNCKKSNETEDENENENENSVVVFKQKKQQQTERLDILNQMVQDVMTDMKHTHDYDRSSTNEKHVKLLDLIDDTRNYIINEISLLVQLHKLKKLKSNHLEDDNEEEKEKQKQKEENVVSTQADIIHAIHTTMEVLHQLQSAYTNSTQAYIKQMNLLMLWDVIECTNNHENEEIQKMCVDLLIASS